MKARGATSCVEAQYYRMTSEDKVPWKWMVPSCKYPHKSDVWNFAVVIGILSVSVPLHGCT